MARAKKAQMKFIGILFVFFAFLYYVSAENVYNKSISLAPSTTEIIYAINAQDKLIGNTIFCDYPEDAKNKTKIGGFTTPNIEKIISLRPDLVFAHGLIKPDDIKLLQEANITVIIINTTHSIEGIYEKIRKIAKYLGKEAEGENLINNMKKRIENVKKIKNELVFSYPSVALITWADPLRVTGRNTFMNDVIEIAGGKNVYSDIHRWGKVSIETLIERNPDIIIAPFGKAHNVYDNIINNTNFRNLKAVKNNNVYKIPEDIILRDSPRVIDALEHIIGMIISYQSNNTIKYCINDTDCIVGKCDPFIHICKEKISINITKISGEKYGDEFVFKVTTNEGIPVENATVNVYGQTLKTDANGTVKITIKAIKKIEVFAYAKGYEASNISFEIKPRGILKVKAPERAKEGETITIIVIDENENPVPNAKIIINKDEYIVDVNGKIEYNVTTSLKLKAEKEGYISSEEVSVAIEPKLEFLLLLIVLIAIFMVYFVFRRWRKKK